MVSFVPKTQYPQEQSYINYSRGYDRIQGDKTLGTLFEGVGNIAEAAVTAVDEVNKSDIDKRLYSSVDPIRDAQGAGLNPDDISPPRGPGTSLLTDEAGDRVPYPVKEGLEKMATLDQAFREGKRDRLYYASQLNSVSKELRSQYPGYRRYIDERMSSITGMNPANTMVTETQERLQKLSAAEDAKAKEFRTWAKQKMDKIQVMEPGFFLNPEKYNQRTLMDKVARLEAEEYRVDLLKKEAGLAKELGMDWKTSNIRAYTEVVNLATKKPIAAILSEYERQKSALYSGNNADPTKMKAVIQMIDNQIAKVKIGVDQIASGPVDPKTPGSPSWKAKIGDVTEIEKINGNMIAQLTALRDAIKDGSKDTAEYLSQQLRIRDAEDDLRLGNNAEKSRKMASIARRLGPAGVPVMDQLWRQGNTLPEMIKELSNAHLTDVITAEPDKPVPGPSKLIDDTKAKTGKAMPAEGANVMLNRYADVMLKMDDEASRNAAKSFFEDKGFFARLSTTEDGMKLFRKMASPEMTKRISQLGEQDSNIWMAYKTWTTDSAKALFGRNFNDVASLSQNQSRKYNWDYNTDTNQIVLAPRTGTSTAPSAATADLAAKKEVEVAQKLNQVLKLLEPVYSGDGEDVGPQVLKLLGVSGVDLSKSKEPAGQTPGPKSIWDVEGPGGSLLDSLRKRFMPDAPPDPVAPTTPGKRSEAPGEPQGDVSLVQRASLTTGAGNAPAAPARVPRTAPEYANLTVTQIASRFNGLDERADKAVLASFIKQGTGKSIDPQKTAWCAAFANAVLGVKGERGTGSLMAKSFLNYGKPTDKPKEGDIVVLTRGNPNSAYGHVGFFAGRVKHGGEEYIQVLGGNQRNSVNVQEFPASRVLGYRRVSALDAQKYAEANPGEVQMAQANQPVDTFNDRFNGAPPDEIKKLLDGLSQEKQRELMDYLRKQDPNLIGIPTPKEVLT